MDSLVRFAMAAAILIGASNAFAVSRGGFSRDSDPNRPVLNQRNVAADRWAEKKKNENCPRLAMARAAGLEPDNGTAASAATRVRAHNGKTAD